MRGAGQLTGFAGCERQHLSVAGVFRSGIGFVWQEYTCLIHRRLVRLRRWVEPKWTIGFPLNIIGCLHWYAVMIAQLGKGA